MGNDDTFENPAFALEEGKQQRHQTGGEPDIYVEKSEHSSSKSLSYRSREVQTDDYHDTATNEFLCGAWSLVKRTCEILYSRRGLLLAICSALCFSVKALFLEVLTQTVDPFQIVVMIMPILVLGSLIYLTWKRIPLPKEWRLYGWLLLGGVSLSSYLSLFTLSLTKMEVADAVTVVYTSLVFVGFLSWVILKETPTVFYVVFSLLSFLGVVFIARPPFLFGNEAKNREVGDLLIGTGFALGAAFSVAIILNAVRKQTKLGIDTVVTMLCNAVIVVLTNAVICTVIMSWSVPSTLECLYATGAGLSYSLAQLTLYLALKFETATIVNIVLTIEIVFTFLWQFAFLQIHPFWTSYVGAVLVVAACIGMTLKEKRQTSEGADDTS